MGIVKNKVEVEYRTLWEPRDHLCGGKSATKNKSICSFYQMVLCAAPLTYSMEGRMMSFLSLTCPHHRPQTCDRWPDMAEGPWQMSLRLKNLRRRDYPGSVMWAQWVTTWILKHGELFLAAVRERCKNKMIRETDLAGSEVEGCARSWRIWAASRSQKNKTKQKKTMEYILPKSLPQDMQCWHLDFRPVEFGTPVEP